MASFVFHILNYWDIHDYFISLFIQYPYWFIVGLWWAALMIVMIHFEKEINLSGDAADETFDV